MRESCVQKNIPSPLCLWSRVSVLVHKGVNSFTRLDEDSHKSTNRNYHTKLVSNGITWTWNSCGRQEKDATIHHRTTNYNKYLQVMAMARSQRIDLRHVTPCIIANINNKIQAK